MKNIQNRFIKHFPNIYRIITENLLVKKYKFKTIIFILVFLLVIFIFISIVFINNILSFLNLTNQRQILIKKVNFLKSVSDKYEGYKDIYFQIAVYEYKLGNFSNARINNNKALLLDPNFKDARSLEVLINEAL